MDFLAHAEEAQDIASEFLIFQAYLPSEAIADLSELATELFGIKTALLDLHEECRDPHNFREAQETDEEQYVVIQSLGHTFRDIHRLLGGLGRSWRSRREAYQTTWKRLGEYFVDESGNTLCERLRYYKIFILDLINIVIGHDEHPGFENLFREINELLELQEDAHPHDPALRTPRPTRSWERRRPGLGRPSRQPPPPNARVPPPRVQPVNTRTGYRRPLSPGFPGQGSPLPPHPGGSSSPPSSVTTSSLGESNDTSSSMSAHWLAEVWMQHPSNTQFHTTGTESACFGKHARGASRKLREEHEKILALPFEQHSLELRVYLRERDRKARIWCRTERRRGSIEAVQPVQNLRIVRRDSCLQLCKLDSRRQLRLWANLRFLSYERLVLFHCSFLALKAQEERSPPADLDDHILHGEITVFSAKIHDDGYVHALQIFKDEDSQGVRLQASVLRGPMKRSPVWTAFIKYNMMAREWISKSEPKKVLLAELSRYIFTDDYEPQLAPTGEHELHFSKREHADEFVGAIEDVAEGRI